jgi:glutaconate CoA-transferase subunit A
MMKEKLMDMRSTIAAFVEDGMTVAIEGFTAFICFAAAHEIIRQGRRDLVLARMTPDLVYDQMIAAGTARKLIFSYLGNPGVGSLHCIRRAVEGSFPAPIEVEEYSHFGMIGRYTAGASRLPFYPLRSYAGTDLPQANPKIRFIADPFGGGEIAVVPPLEPDVGIIHAQRADVAGNTQAWGILGVQKEVAFASKRTIVVVEELVPPDVIRSDPNRTIIPGTVVDAVVHEPYGAHPSYVQGYYDRDNQMYRQWDELSRDAEKVSAWLDDWVFGVEDRQGYVRKLGEARIKSLRPDPAPAAEVDYGVYR